jgi:hypothetical protein
MRRAAFDYFCDTTEDPSGHPAIRAGWCNRSAFGD